MPTIRILDETKDVEELKTAWSWFEETPAWFKESLASSKETLADFLRSAENELLIGIFEKQITAVLRIVPQNGVYELHLMAKRRTDWGILVQAFASVRDFLSERGIDKFGGWIPKKNRAIIRLYRSLGFQYNGIRCFQGKTHGKIIEWYYFSLTK